MSGVADVVRYNRGVYLRASVGIAAGLAARRLPLPRIVRFGIDAAVAATTYFTVSSLVATYAVYDRSTIFSWRWIAGSFPTPPAAWINVHAGLDESTGALRELFAGSEGRAIDMYDAATMHEPSIAVARERTDASASIAARPESLPAADGSLDAAFALFAAHEVRDRTQREALFHEFARTLAGGGRLVLAEHVRDWRNFLAFGPGFRHFRSASEWRRLGRLVGFRLESERRLAFLVRAFVFENVAERRERATET